MEHVGWQLRESEAALKKPYGVHHQIEQSISSVEKARDTAEIAEAMGDKEIKPIREKLEAILSDLAQLEEKLREMIGRQD
jgi:chromosome segregation ATPase